MKEAGAVNDCVVGKGLWNNLVIGFAAVDEFFEDICSLSSCEVSSLKNSRERERGID